MSTQEVRESLRSGLIAPICSFALAYLIGSLPSAYLLVKWKSRIDVRGAGSGNVGALNAFEVTGSKALGLGVLLADLAKGSGSVMLCCALFGGDFWVRGCAGVGVICGHNYPVWLRFKGGRGLAAAAGVMLAVNWVIVPLWCAVWLAGNSLLKNVHRSNIIASIATPALTVPVVRIVRPGMDSQEATETLVLISVICLMILLRHLETFRKLLSRS